ncbi:four helix bundle protein [Lewinella sp. W8]|uniref:four helix bundle protein n=1 Tax=Lewinella sp. W8 TaxID=2528208 RepID=UPI00106837A3|nr:four helix bundle protein [Lewinella sp. W8]MTB52151.1 four helix bundle protein [Lewinella sp. W8]
MNTRALELEERLIDFAVNVIDFAEQLPKSLAGKHLSGQIIRSGSAPALNYGEARGAASRRDYRHKLTIVVKELRETHINLRIIEKKRFADLPEMDVLLNENNQLISIFVATIKTLDGSGKR